jgi:hypothetical protein
MLEESKKSRLRQQLDKLKILSARLGGRAESNVPFFVLLVELFAIWPHYLGFTTGELL